VTATVERRSVGAWELVERIGGGGQAAVYRVRHAALGRPAALKLVHREIWADPAFRVRFRRECEALLRLRHPHIVPIHDAGEQDGRGFLVMALARDGSLAARLTAGPLGPVEATALLGPVADALDAAHAAGLVHRDVTPANVLLDPDGPWLADFGIARRLDATAMTAEGLLVGTAGFLAPEVIEGRPAGPASDRYALAAVAFEAMTGRPPFRADGAPGLLFAHVNRPVPRASSLRPGLPPGIDAALQRGLAKDPRARPATARELVDSLRPGARRARGRLRRAARPALVAAVAAVAAAGAATGLALTLGGGGDPPPPPQLATVVTEPPLTVPAPGGRELPAHPAAVDDLPGLAGAAGAAAADVGELRVVSVPGGAGEMAAAADALASPGMWVEPLEVDEEQIGLVVRSPIDLVGTMDRWALRAVGGHVVLIRGRGSEPARYAAGLSA
jgi:tRNA A-37 threonylcarbamoyl transferase component Bud32